MGSRTPAALYIGLIGLVLVACSLWFGDRLGFEGDDVAMLFGIANFERVGINDVYRYHWQPLVYEALVPFARGLRSGFDIMFVGNIAGAETAACRCRVARCPNERPMIVICYQRE